MQHNGGMKSSILPQVRVEPDLRAGLEAVLRKGETLSEFVVASVRSAVEYRREQTEFLARGEAAWREYRRNGVAYPAAQVVSDMRDLLEAKRKKLKSKSSPKR